jgi:cyanophycin synthetase
LAERGRVLFERLKPFAANGLNLFPMVDAALDLGIEVRRLTGRVISLGVGARSRLFDSTLSDRTPSIGVQLARSKMMCNEVLRAAGLPAPPQQVARSPEDAIKASQTLGFPVVIKPVDRDRGEGVAADLRSSNAVRVAYAAAAAYSTEILVERHIPGSTHRLTVWDGRVVRVTRRITAGVTGDGVSSVEQLIERLREDPVHKRRAERMGKVLIELDDEAQSLLGQQGLTARSVPAAGQRVRLRRRDNINAGGINEQIPLDRVHPDNVALALRAARILRLDIAGIDYITEDVSQSWMDCGGGICEVNAQPQIGISDTPDLYHRLLLEAMPDLGRIPIELHVYAEDPPPVPPESSEPARFNSRACSRSLEIDGAIVLANPPAVFDAIRHALLDPAVRGLLAGMPLSELQAHGSPARWIDLIVAHVPAGWPSRQRQALMEDLQHRFRGHAAGFVLKGD